MPNRFHPVVVLPPEYVVLDLTVPLSQVPHPGTPWTVGRYAEDRAIYTQPLFGGRRTVHLGVDLGGPVGTAVHAPTPGEVVHAGYNPADGDYGHVLVTEHSVRGAPLWVLLGHLSAASVAHSPPGRRFDRGDVLGWLGDRHDNGGWPPHVHVQLALERPATHDLPGAAEPAERAAALKAHPDPRLILGPLY